MRTQSQILLEYNHTYCIVLGLAEVELIFPTAALNNAVLSTASCKSLSNTPVLAQHQACLSNIPSFNTNMGVDKQNFSLHLNFKPKF